MGGQSISLAISTYILNYTVFECECTERIRSVYVYGMLRMCECMYECRSLSSYRVAWLAGRKAEGASAEKSKRKQIDANQVKSKSKSSEGFFLLSRIGICAWCDVETGLLVEQSLGEWGVCDCEKFDFCAGAWGEVVMCNSVVRLADLQFMTRGFVSGSKARLRDVIGGCDEGARH